MIDSKKELFKWGPIDGRLIYVDPFVEAFVPYPDFVQGTWPDIFGFAKHDKVVFIADYENLRNNGSKIFRKYVLDEIELQRGYELWLDVTKKIKRFEHEVNKGLSGMSDEKLKELFIAWNKCHVDFWIRGFLPELSNWGGESILKKKILKFDKVNFIEIFEKISAPENLSFFQKEELEFLKIKLMNPVEREKQLAVHQMNYYWLRNSYGFTKVLDEEWFRNELEKISKENAEKRISEIENYPGKIKAAKKEVIEKYKINKEIIKIAEKLAYCVWWQDYRKSFIFIANHIVSTFIKEISRRKGIEFKELCYYTTNEVEELLEKGYKVDAKERFDGFVEYYSEGQGISYFTGTDALDLVKPYIEIKIDPKQKEFKGMVVSKGEKVRGRARILTTPRELDKMEQGDILVAPMTSPDYIVAMKKAAAIITDEGGMTSHAAIVSRELGVPCIVQTRIATKALKDGEMIEVDTKKGVVRKV